MAITAGGLRAETRALSRRLGAGGGANEGGAALEVSSLQAYYSASVN
jgi:hypothetical protein